MENLTNFPDKKEKEILFAIARKAIESKLFNKRFTYPPDIPASLQKKSGAFVTLKIAGHLRGCIGYVQAIKPLHETIYDMAIAAAFEDPRFVPLSRQEYDNISIEISIITPMVPVKKLEEIEVGKHGLMIKRRFASGLLLPQVATEYNWDRNTFLKETCIKAGLNPDDYLKEGTEILKFSAIVIEEQN